MALPRSRVHVCEVAYRVVSHSSLDWFLFLVLLLDFGSSVAYLCISNDMAVDILDYVNYVFVIVYMTEASLKVRIGCLKNYFSGKHAKLKRH